MNNNVQFIPNSTVTPISKGVYMYTYLILKWTCAPYCDIQLYIW